MRIRASISPEAIRSAITAIAEQMSSAGGRTRPEVCEAFAQLAAVEANIYWEFFDHTESRREKARQAARSASAEPNLAMPTARWDGIITMVFQTMKRYAEFHVALQSKPNDILLLVGMASIYRRQESLTKLRPIFRGCVKSIRGRQD